MSNRTLANVVIRAALALVAFAGAARSTSLLDQTSIVALPTVAAPQQYSFTATATEALTVKLTDLQVPAAFSFLQIAVTQADTLVGTAWPVEGTTSTVAVAAITGTTYLVSVIGTPNATQGIGSFGVCVTRNSDTTHTCVPAYSYSGNIQTPSAPSTSGVSTLDTNFTATSTGTYQVTLTDDQFPVALQMVSATIFNGATQVGGVFPSGTTSVTLTGGVNYTLLIAAQAAASPQAGLYGARITDPSGAVVFERTRPVGSLGASTIVNNPTPQSLTLSLTDFAYPASLNGLGAAVTSGAVELGELTAAGSSPAFAAPAGNLEIWQYATAGASSGVYSLNLASAHASLFSTTQVVNPAGNGSSGSYAFAVQLAAGVYNLSVTDLQFPGQLSSVSSTIAENGAVLTVNSNGDFTTPAAGVAVIVVDAQAPQSGSGIFDVAVRTANTPSTTVLDQTQAVGGVFNTQMINDSAGGSYTVTLTDLGFPTDFQNLAAVFSQGGQVLGKIYGSNAFSVDTTAGQYVLTIVATPGMDNYGLYSVNIASAKPTLTFSASPTTVTAGQTVQLTWSADSATTCTASGSSTWSGNEPVSGTASVAISADVTLMLTCTGTGGSVTQSVAITATPAASSGGGGGGSVDLSLLVLLTATFLARRAGWSRG
jgi:plastocyanin